MKDDITLAIEQMHEYSRNQDSVSTLPIQFSGTTGRSATNNNPLNLEYRSGSYQDKYGAELEPVSSSGEQRFAKFKTMQDGYNAGLDQIRLDQSKGHTLASFVEKFAPRYNNPTDKLISQYSRAIGVTPKTPLRDIDPEKLIIPMMARESSTRIVKNSKNWPSKIGNVLWPSAAHAEELPIQIEGASDEISRAVAESSKGPKDSKGLIGTGLEEDEITKAIRESNGIGVVPTPPTPTIPILAKPSMSDSDYNSILYGQDPLTQFMEPKSRRTKSVMMSNEVYDRLSKEYPKETTISASLYPIPTKPKVKDFADRYYESMWGLMSSPGFGPPPPGGYNELGVPLNAEGKPYSLKNDPNAFTKEIDSLNGLGKDVIKVLKDPHSAIIGTAELGWDIGNFGLGLVATVGVGLRRLPAGIIGIAKGEASILDAYNLMKDQFQRMAEFTDPGKQMMKKALESPADAADYLVKAMGGTPLPRVESKSETVGKIAMLPLALTNAWFQSVADDIHNFDYPMPNAEGLCRFAGEITGLFVVAKFYRGGIRGLKEGMDVLDKEIIDFQRDFYNTSINPSAETQGKLIEQAGKVEATATEIAKGLDPNRPIVDDIQVSGEKAVEKATEKVPIIEEAKPKPLTAVERAIAKKTKEAGKVESEIETKTEPEPKSVSKPKVVPTPPERTIIETDPQESPFRQDPEVTRVRTQAFDERGVQKDLLSIHAKALNDVNRWLDGDKEVSIDQTRRLLSDLAVKVEDPVHDRIMLDILGTPREVELFKKISKESATWARRVKREKEVKIKEKVIPEAAPVEEQIPTSKINQSIKQKFTEPKVEESTITLKGPSPLEKSWKQAEVDAKIAENTMITKDTIEKYYGKGLDELSDSEVISYVERELLGKGEKEGGTELYSGIPVHLIVKAIKNIFRPNKEELPSHEDFKIGQGVKRPNEKYQWKVLGLNSKTGKWDELSIFDTKKEARTNSIQRAVDASVEWTKMYREKMNDPLMQPKEAIAHKKAERAQRNQDAMRAFKEEDFSKWWDSKKKFLGEAIHDKVGRVRSVLLKHFGEGGQRLLSNTEAIPGGTMYGEGKARQMIREVGAGLSKETLKVLFDYHMFTRYADIWKDNPKWKIPTKGGEIAPTKDDVIMNLLNFKEYHNLSDAEFKLIQERSELMFEHMRNWIDDSLLPAGIIGPKEAKDLKDHRYTKMKTLRNWSDVFDVEIKNKVGDKKTTNYESGLQQLKGGGVSIVEADQFIVYTEVAKMLYGRAAIQRSRQAMRNFATQFPNNGMIWHKGLEGKRPKGWVKDYVWDFETPVESIETSYPSRQPIWLHPDFAHQVTTVSYDMSLRFAWAAKVFGADLVRALAVGTSAVWATVVNLPIDILHTFFSPRIFKDGKEVGTSKAKAIFSPFFPKYLAELGSNYIDVAPDVWNRGPKYNAYAKYGGLLQFLTQRQSHITGHMHRPGKFDQLLDILSAHGRNTELLTRVSIMDRVVEQKANELGITKDELWKRENARPESEILRLATHIARENMPYGQTGWFIKALDRFIPFLGANYVGARTFWRASIERPADFAVRVANIGAAAVGITALNLLYNPEAYRKIDDNKKSRNVVIPYFPDYLNFIDSKGNKRTWNMTIPGTGGPMFFYNLFTGLTHKLMYEVGMTSLPPSYDAIIKSLGQNAPVQTMLPPVLSGVVSYSTNYSFWRNDYIFKEEGGRSFNWPYSVAEGMNNPNVSQLAKDIGKVTRLSPKRLQAFAGELFPKNNEFIWLFGKPYEMLLSNVPEKLRERVFQETMATIPGVNRLFDLSIDEAFRRTGGASRERQESEIEKRNYLRRSEFKLLMEERERGGDVRDRLMDFYRKVGKEDRDARDRFRDESDKLRQIEKLSNKTLWKGMLNKSDELKAMDYYERMKVESSPEEQDNLRKELRILDNAGFVGEKFFKELRRLRRNEE